jgi:hypothetical protein
MGKKPIHAIRGETTFQKTRNNTISEGWTGVLQSPSLVHATHRDSFPSE